MKQTHKKLIGIYLKPLHKTVGGFSTVPQLEATSNEYKNLKEAKNAFLKKFNFLTSEQVFAKYLNA